MTLPRLESLSHSELIEKIKSIRSTERLASAEVVLYLFEIDTRGIFRDYGYSSLFTFCTVALGYSEGSAWRRVAAARCLKENPEVYEKLRSGALTLCAVAELSKVMTVKNKAELLTASEGLSKREVERLTAPHRPKMERARDRIVTKAVEVEPDLFNTQTEPSPVEVKHAFHFEGDEEFMKLFEECKALVGHTCISEVLKRTMKAYLHRRSPQRRERRRAIRAKLTSRSRHIPVKVRDQVFLRDNEQCCYVSPDGKRCEERHALELDHIEPFSLGGEHTAENLRVLCRAHNGLMAERVFGPERRSASSAHR